MLAAFASVLDIYVCPQRMRRFVRSYADVSRRLAMNAVFETCKSASAEVLQLCCDPVDKHTLVCLEVIIRESR